MGRLINTTTMTVDGLTDVGPWFVGNGGHDAAGREQFVNAAGMVLGRKCFEGLAAFWSQQDDEWAHVLNPMPKFVASRTLEGPLTWNARLIEGEVAAGVTKLKEELDGDLMLTGCGELANYLLDNSVIDEVRFWVHPSIYGEGNRPYLGKKISMQLVGTESFDSGVVLLRYEPLTAERG